MARFSGPGSALADALSWGADFGDLRARSEPKSFVVNPLYPGADPYVARHGEHYYYCQAGPGGGIEVWRGSSLTDRGERAVVWTPPARGWNSRQIWAPELHLVRGRWYIYYAASDGRNANHRMGVLAATGDDPQGEFVDAGQLYTGDDVRRGTRNRWAIDGTVLDHNGQLYLIWSGWADHRDVQHLYIARMSDATTVSSDRVRLCANDCHLWERCGERRGERGLNEGPQVLVRHGRVMIVYSASGSWQTTYKLGLLTMDVAADPMDCDSWRKLDQPVFESSGEVFGVGHCCFTTSPDGREDWILYHSKRYRWNGWDRVVRAQPFRWTEDGLPDFGRPVPSGVPLAAPSEDHAVLTLSGAAHPAGLAASPDRPQI
ncbi:MAG TPA: glycoside hydrolase family 43 protein [Tepidisphaeraceae bacterium]|nr:glycoside hydrolase family 43 protein [Tepidisphaeraceae bacterium]